MGLVCSCGVLVDAFVERDQVMIEGVMGTVTGSLTYLADVCVDRLDTSTLSLQFDQTEGGTDNSFTFTATEITTVVCRREGQNCEVTVEGFGTVNGETFPFEAVFRDQVEQAAVDIVQSFEIIGFFDQTGANTIDQGSIIALGCE
ncbi:hypothetical protein SM124_14855 [Bacillus sp. 31A1R]|uniref:Uncharacterized protein n=1 Tax=Robertmurraya mangrovi TaxID=3098077 RepID=A0ABU5J0Q0_9BACI|nr:hypothetical protein [Bacillus sp. 31A1R]MDZ5472995.1 hypothetical protein [Bacillus sp. 31A1R]